MGPFLESVGGTKPGGGIPTGASCDALSSPPDPSMFPLVPIVGANSSSDHSASWECPNSRHMSSYRDGKGAGPTKGQETASIAAKEPPLSMKVHQIQAQEAPILSTPVSSHSIPNQIVLVTVAHNRQIHPGTHRRQIQAQEGASDAIV
ncbi:hypothetical protein L1987_40062 [Smallanthus sonchifolius]|uniref:Uncharacterized protein n=1 Tax=Smallanthus sonchifolius TaxID=185202 RepID=A0ACB9GTW4_9ASTR|nr:hypothetical protein L1987_40062 [Smallanthus sonchifolius]